MVNLKSRQQEVVQHWSLHILMSKGVTLITEYVIIIIKTKMSIGPHHIITSGLAVWSIRFWDFTHELIIKSLTGTAITSHVVCFF